MSNDAKTRKKLPPLLTDEEAERFTDEADLSDYDLSGFKTVRFELKKKDRTVSLPYRSSRKPPKPKEFLTNASCATP